MAQAIAASPIHPIQPGGAGNRARPEPDTAVSGVPRPGPWATGVAPSEGSQTARSAPAPNCQARVGEPRNAHGWSLLASTIDSTKDDVITTPSTDKTTPDRARRLRRATAAAARTSTGQTR